ncbi:MAG: ABC transporter ATP-binding protein [Planctomycetales bacterium]|nr:ABC transporter ATP-binding protein [Planctomycetales bacterium]
MTSCISVRGLAMHYRGCDALDGVDLEVPSGSVFALLGENGAGKTTLIRILTGFQRPSAGSCTVCGLDPTTDSLEIRRRIGYVSDAPALYDWMRVGEIGWFAASFFNDEFLARYRELVDRYELPESRKIRHLSKGQRAKVALALAISHDPELLILDEPTSGLDPLVRREFLESMVDRAATGRTVLLSSHQISEVERVADRVAILRSGRVKLVDTLADLKESICSVTVTLSDSLAALPALPSPAEVLSEQREGRQHRWMVRNFTPEHRAELESRPAVLSLRTRAASLDELFVACTRGIAPVPELMEDEAHQGQGDRQAS